MTHVERRIVQLALEAHKSGTAALWALRVLDPGIFKTSDGIPAAQHLPARGQALAVSSAWGLLPPLLCRNHQQQPWQQQHGGSARWSGAAAFISAEAGHMHAWHALDVTAPCRALHTGPRKLWRQQAPLALAPWRRALHKQQERQEEGQQQPQQQQPKQGGVEPLIAARRHHKQQHKQQARHASGASLASLPNLISFSRVVAAPVISYQMATGQWGPAVALLTVAAVSARHA
jgi:hypothetical protein